MKLWQVAKLIRSKNAGPFELTFDVILKDRATYEKVRDAKVINVEWFARTYRLQPEVVSIINYDAANAIKVTIHLVGLRPVSVFSIRQQITAA